MNPLTLEWIQKAEEDYLVAKREHEQEPPALNAVSFHCQQCVEKYFKAILQEKGVLFEKIHDLDVLLEQCKEFLPELSNHKTDLVELSSFAVEVRYPGVTATEEEAKGALSTAETIRAIVRKYFGLSG